MKVSGLIPVYVGVRRTQFKIKSIKYKSLFVQNRTNSANIKNHLRIKKTFHYKMNHSEVILRQKNVKKLSSVFNEFIKKFFAQNNFCDVSEKLSINHFFEK